MKINIVVSDKEIEKAAKVYIKSLKIHKDYERFEASYEFDFVAGAKWMKERIENQK